MNEENIIEQITLMKAYLLHKLDIEDYHGLWDSAIDIQRLVDKLDYIRKLKK